MFFDNFKESIDNTNTINESKYNISIDDSMNLVFESYVNDYTIFEAVLRRDLLETTGILTEDGDKNFFASIWERIVTAFKTIREKISSMINNFIEKIQKHKQEQANKVVAKYKELFGKENGELKEFKYKCTVMNTPDLDYTKFNVSIPNFDDSTEESIKAHMEKMTDSKKIKEDIRKEFWSDKTTENPFKDDSELKDCIVTNIENNLESKKSIKTLKKNLLKDLKDKEDYATRKSNEVKKNKEMSKEDKNKQINLAQLYLKAISATQKEIAAYVSAVLNGVASQYKLSYKLYISGGKFLEKKLGTKATKPEKEKEDKVKKAKGEVQNDEKDTSRNRANGEIVYDSETGAVDTSSSQKSDSKFDNIRNSAVDADVKEAAYIDALIEAEFFEYDI